MKNIIFIVGPTATGKSEVAYKLSKKISADIISCDSMLVYKEPRIITSKPSYDFLREIKHYFIDIISVKDTYNVFLYFKEAKKIIEELHSKIPLIVCGGTGLYFKALLDGIFEGVSQDESLRKKLKEKAEKKGSVYLYDELKRIDPLTAGKISPSDLKRIIRALEVYYLSGKSIQWHKEKSKGLWGEIPIKIFGFTLKRELLYKRIDQRVEKMFEEGAIEEVRRILKIGPSLTAEKIIGIKEIASFLEGKITFEEAKDLMKKNTRHFAKRQFTWFRKDKRIDWIDIEGKSSNSIVEEILKNV